MDGTPAQRVEAGPVTTPRRLSPTPLALAFAAGCGGFAALPRLPGPWLPWLLAGLASVLLLAAAGWRRRLPAALAPALLVSLVAAGALWAYQIGRAHV